MYPTINTGCQPQEIALLAIEGHVIWTLETIESSITVDIKGVNPGFDIDTHVSVYDPEIKGIEAETQQTIQSIETPLETLANVTEECCVSVSTGDVLLLAMSGYT